MFPRYEIEEGPASLHSSFLVGPYASCGPGPHESIPHRHAFVELVWVSAGCGTHVIDASHHAVRPRTLHIVARGEVHQWKLHDSALKGTLVLFRDDFLTGPGGFEPPIWRGGVAAPDQETSMRIDRILSELQTEILGRKEGRELAARSLLTALLVVCSRVMTASAYPRHGLPARFERFVLENTRATLSVAECARALSVTSSHLSEVVTATTGRSPGEIIRSAILLEAQRLLTRSSLTCAQVAASLAFEDPSYFSRFFRREAGTTPSCYRSSRA